MLKAILIVTVTKETASDYFHCMHFFKPQTKACEIAMVSVERKENAGNGFPLYN